MPDRNAADPLVRVLLSLAIACWAPALAAAGQAPTLPGFEIEDQFGRVHTREALRGKVVVAVASGRGGREANSAWGEALRRELAPEISADRVRILPVADVRGVPGFLKGRVRSGFPDEPARWILLDWEGRFAETFDLDGDESTVLLFTPEGALLSRTAEGEPDEIRVRIIGALAREALGTEAMSAGDESLRRRW